MPKTKKRLESDSDSDSGPEDVRINILIVP